VGIKPHFEVAKKDAAGGRAGGLGRGWAAVSSVQFPKRAVKSCFNSHRNLS